MPLRVEIPNADFDPVSAIATLPILDVVNRAGFRRHQDLPMQKLFREAIVWGCLGWLSTCPNYGVRSNTLPLAFGMTPAAASAALQSPLSPVAGGRRGSDIYYTDQTAVATGFIVAERERLWMQFRGGRLTGWQYDWDRPMAW